ncbi:helix-turn-helix transcriptional regulator [Rhodopseudomonas palustris]|uniref:helix-turn-helix transcriptional regulator n=1 Tax=Rhodopseudomonas palustris TaxID=1076 RepID=UPI0009B96E1E|nr:helix-turn-helix transcriptional regulator [Rhodopseudomonas palustris]
MTIPVPTVVTSDLSRPATPAAFAEAVMVSLRPVFGASRAVLSDRRCGRPGEMHFVNWPAWCQAHYCAEVRARDPIRGWLDGKASEDGVTRLSELLPAARRTGLSPEPLLADSGAGFVLIMALRGQNRIVGALSLVRDAGHGDFDERDRGLAMALLPLLEMAYHGVIASGAATVPLCAGNDPLYALTPREREVAALASAGHSNKSIARMLATSPWTIKNQMRAALQKAGVRNRTELSALWNARSGEPR